MALSSRLPADGIVYERAPDRPPHLEVKGVSISVAPDLLLRFEHRGLACIGALKLHYPKGEASDLGQEGSEYVAVMLHRWLLENGPSGCKPLPSHCLSVDVFRKRIVGAPTANTRRWNNIVVGCEEFAVRWDQL